MKITKRIDPRTVETAELVQKYKYDGLSRQEAWNQYVKDMALKPEVDAKDIFWWYDNLEAKPLDDTQEKEFNPTHFDHFFKCRVQITTDENGVHYFLWENGSYGSNPPFMVPDTERFEEI